MTTIAIRQKNLPAVTAPTAADVLALDGATTRGIPIENFVATFGVHAADVVAAATLNLNAAIGDVVDVTGNTGITAITLSDGDVRTVRFTGTPLLTNGASLVLPGGRNVQAVAGDFAIFRGYGSGVVRCVTYSPPPATTTNDSAAAGQIGEFINASVASGSAVALTTNVAANVTSISLTAGDWDVSGVVALIPAGGTPTTFLAAGITTTTAALPAVVGTGSGNLRLESWPANLATSAGFAPPQAVLNTRMSLASTTTVFLVAFATFTVSTNGAYGFIRARRVR